ncbi:MAG: DUF1295 domain-containing protein [Bdellovibrionaceae bacterium]|nr:DUF1295 domain-containing protein [Pseudobdellovibrionaceae bacterium]
MLNQILCSIFLAAIYFFVIWFVLLIVKQRATQLQAGTSSPTNSPTVTALTLSHGFWFLSFLVPFALDFYLDGMKHANIIMFAMVCLWALRQSLFHFLRLRHVPKDSRYQELTRKWQPQHFKANSLVYVILPQMIAHILLATGFYIYLSSPDTGWSSPAWNVPLAWVFLFGLILQTLADLQLYRFKKDPKNHNLTYTGGVWRWIKYPNYFGEFLIWLSFGLLALPFKYGYIGLLTPIVSLLLLTRWTGIGLLEKKRSTQKSAPHLRPKYNWIPWIY